MRRPIVGVLGSGTEAWSERAHPLGAWLAARGVHLLTGGGAGVMASVSEAFAASRDRSGLVLGVLPGLADEPTRSRPGYPNAFVEIPIRTHLPHSGERGTDPLSRNHINVLTPQVLVALPGGAGTASEVRLAVEYGRPVVAWIEDPAELPDLPPEAATARSLDEVTRFVDAHLDADP